MTETSSTSTGRMSASRPTAERIIDGDTYHAQVDLGPVGRPLLTDLGRAIYRSRSTWRLSIIGNPSTDCLTRAKHLDALLQDPAVQAALLLPLGPDQAEELGGELLDAHEEPAKCDCFDNYATSTDGLCDDCRALAEYRSDRVAAIRAV